MKHGLLLRCCFLILLVFHAGGKEYVVANYEGKVLPKQIFTFSMPAEGTLSDFRRHTQQADKGDLLARINGEMIAREEKELHLKIKKLQLQSNVEIADLEKTAREIGYLLSLSPRERQYISGTQEPTQRSLRQIEEQIDFAKEQIVFESEQARKEFERRKSRFEIRMPYEGQFQYHFPLPKEKEEIMLGANFPVVTVIDTSIYYIAVVLSDPYILKRDPRDFKIRFQVGGRLGTALFSHKNVEKQNDADVLVHYFKIEPAFTQFAQRLYGTLLEVELVFLSKSPILYLEKRVIIERARHLSYDTWEEIIRLLYPKSQLIFIGDSHVALGPNSGTEEAG